MWMDAKIFIKVISPKELLTLTRSGSDSFKGRLPECRVMPRVPPSPGKSILGNTDAAGSANLNARWVIPDRLVPSHT